MRSVHVLIIWLNCIKIVLVALIVYYFFTNNIVSRLSFLFRCNGDGQKILFQESLFDEIYIRSCLIAEIVLI